ncbi:MAG: lysine biosynthesis protein LysX [Chloroflexi bacterium]|nr:lysine biosynthesis protein LysX [Chloroflexota bacterium]MCI0772326.1 lysine biosynthesis protein LysX [Chloroflexota bacterium]MCI0806313.1 lysine biosynthesis protein LysX [Chloroflexota bacterium]MCI0828211.1 lysine biosynthesis protein LysX [Chloroflexota bacterium]MCI0853096.1 lysine biosynthesis protein LysX [Chloroflexota bacterium]
MRVAMIITRARAEEKLLLKAFQRRGIEPELIRDEELVLNPLAIDPRWSEFDIVFLRTLSTSRGLYLLEYFDRWEVPTVNSLRTANICADKFKTSLALARAGLPQPEVRLAFTPRSTLEAVGELGYPAVLKPLVGSWGRLLAKVNDVDAAEAVLEHRQTLGNFAYHVHFVQSYVDKPHGRDIRAFVIAGQTICAIYRSSSHWVTSTARGALAENCPVGAELQDLCQRASDAVGGGVLAMDLFETEEGLVLNEINHGMEFRNSIEPTGVDIAIKVVDYALSLAEQHRQDGSEQT